VFSQFFWLAALQQLTGLLADGTWVPMATVHFVAVTAGRLAAWMAVRAKGQCFNGTDLSLRVRPSAGLSG
jgi:hypothetical protein